MLVDRLLLKAVKRHILSQLIGRHVVPLQVIFLLLDLVKLIQHFFHVLSVHSLRLVPVDDSLVVIIALALDVFIPGLEFGVLRRGRFRKFCGLSLLRFVFLFLFLLDQDSFVHVLQEVRLVFLEFFIGPLGAFD